MKVIRQHILQNQHCHNRGVDENDAHGIFIVLRCGIDDIGGRDRQNPDRRENIKNILKNRINLLFFPGFCKGKQRLRSNKSP